MAIIQLSRPQVNCSSQTIEQACIHFNILCSGSYPRTLLVGQLAHRDYRESFFAPKLTLFHLSIEIRRRAGLEHLSIILFFV